MPKYFGGGGGGGGGAVTSVFGRIGAVVATLGDYAASLISNNSSVTGVTVKDALNTLLAAIPSVPVSSVFGRTGAIVAALNDYAASLVNNDSTVTGATVKDALNTLKAASGVASFNTRTGAVVPATGDYTTSQVNDASGLPGTTASDSLNYLGSQAAAAATGATPVLDFAVSRYYVLTLSANCTPTWTIPPVGVEAILEVIQGAGPYTLTLPATVDYDTVTSGGGAPSLTSVSGNRNIFKLLSNGTRMRLAAHGEYA